MRRKRSKGLMVIEGADGAGKATQVALLKDRLEREGKTVVVYDFPQYEKTFFGAKVGEFLRGKYGDLDEVHPFLAAVLYSGDRFQVAESIRGDLAEGKVVLCNRYTSASLGHGAAKFKEKEEREGFVKDIEEMEYEVLGIPEPELVIYLHVAAGEAQKLLDKKGRREYLRGTGRDIAERKVEHQEEAIKAFRWLVRNRENVVEVDCMEGGRVLEPVVIGERVWKVVSERSKGVDSSEESRRAFGAGLRL